MAAKTTGALDKLAALLERRWIFFPPGYRLVSRQRLAGCLVQTEARQRSPGQAAGNVAACPDRHAGGKRRVESGMTGGAVLFPQQCLPGRLSTMDLQAAGESAYFLAGGRLGRRRQCCGL